MPANRGTSIIARKLGDRARKAHEKHRADETDFGSFSSLPDGIEGGVAQLESCKIVPIPAGKENAGELQFQCVGVVKRPEEFNGLHTAGMQTRIFEPLFDTPNRSRKTFEDHWGWMLNELRKLGLDTTSVEFDSIEEELAALEEAAPYFLFRTWKGQKQTEGQFAGREPRVQSQWQGICEFDESSGQVTGGPADFTGGPGNGEAGPEPFDADRGAGAAGEGEGGDEAGGAAAQDLDALVEAAEDDQDDAIEELTRLAVEAGMPEARVKKAKTWAEVADFVRSTNGQGGEEPGAEPEASEPAAPAPKPKDPVRYKPLDPATRKPARKAVECVVLSVDNSKQTVVLRSLDNPRLQYKDVPWGALEG